MPIIPLFLSEESPPNLQGRIGDKVRVQNDEYPHTLYIEEGVVVFRSPVGFHDTFSDTAFYDAPIVAVLSLDDPGKVIVFYPESWLSLVENFFLISLTGTPQTKTVGQNVTLTLEVYGKNYKEFRWYKDGIPIFDGTTSWGTVISDADTFFDEDTQGTISTESGAMTLTGLAEEDAGNYHCVCVNEDGRYISTDVVLVVNSV